MGLWRPPRGRLRTDPGPETQDSRARLLEVLRNGQASTMPSRFREREIIFPRASSERAASCAAFGDGDEAEVPVRRMYLVVAAQDAEDGDAEGFYGFAEHLLVGLWSRRG